MTKLLMTSLQEIANFLPCEEGWYRVCEGRNSNYHRAAQNISGKLFPITECLEYCIISDICWLFGKRKNEIQLLVKFAKLCADSVKQYAKYTEAAANYVYAAANYANYAATTAATTTDTATTNYAKYAYAAAKYAADAADAANYAADAANYAAEVANYAAEAANYAAYKKQKELNKQFFIQAIQEWENSHD